MGILDKAKDFLASDKGEQYSDKGLDAAARAADRMTGGKHADKIQSARDSIDERIGNEGADGAADAGTGGNDGATGQPGAGGTADAGTGGNDGPADPADRPRG